MDNEQPASNIDSSWEEIEGETVDTVKPAPSTPPAEPTPEPDPIVKPESKDEFYKKTEDYILKNQNNNLFVNKMPTQVPILGSINETAHEPKSQNNFIENSVSSNQDGNMNTQEQTSPEAKGIKKIYVFAIIILAVALGYGGYYLFKNQKSNPTTTPTTSPTQSIKSGEVVASELMLFRGTPVTLESEQLKLTFSGKDSGDYLLEVESLATTTCEKAKLTLPVSNTYTCGGIIYTFSLDTKKSTDIKMVVTISREEIVSTPSATPTSSAAPASTSNASTSVIDCGSYDINVTSKDNATNKTCFESNFQACTLAKTQSNNGMIGANTTYSYEIKNKNSNLCDIDVKIIASSDYPSWINSEMTCSYDSSEKDFSTAIANLLSQISAGTSSCSGNLYNLIVNALASSSKT